MATSRTMLSLPELKPKVRYHGIPRRYEETKPVVVQDFTHRKIMDIGQDIHVRTLERCSVEREFAIRRAEETVWTQAELLKREALEKANMKARFEHEKAIKKIQKAHEKAIKEKTVQVEGEMQKVMQEAIQETRLEGEQNLRVAVQQTEQHCHQELLQAVAAARDEERKIAASRAAEVAKQEQEKFEAAMKKASEEKGFALQSLEDIKNRERENAVAEAHKIEQDIASDKLAIMKRSFEEQISELKEQISGKVDAISELKQELENMEVAKQQVQREMLVLRDDFQNFIDKTDPFEKGKAGYLIPPVRSFELP